MVLENFLWGPGKSWKSPGFLSVKEWEPWLCVWWFDTLMRTASVLTNTWSE